MITEEIKENKYVEERAATGFCDVATESEEGKEEVKNILKVLNKANKALEVLEFEERIVVDNESCDVEDMDGEYVVYTTNLLDGENDYYTNCLSLFNLADEINGVLASVISEKLGN